MTAKSIVDPRVINASTPLSVHAQTGRQGRTSYTSRKYARYPAYIHTCTRVRTTGVFILPNSLYSYADVFIMSFIGTPELEYIE